jgi:hypothetical protein
VHRGRHFFEKYPWGSRVLGNLEVEMGKELWHREC